MLPPLPLGEGWGEGSAHAHAMFPSACIAALSKREWPQRPFVQAVDPMPTNATPNLPLPDSVDAVIALLATENYVCDRRLATALFLSLKLARPLFLEGEPGVGKTELA